MTVLKNHSWRALGLGFAAASSLVIGACCTTGPRQAGGFSAPGTPARSKNDLRCDVQIIVVTSDGKTYPDHAKIYRHQVVVWVGDGTALNIKWEATNPFPRLPQPSGRFVYSIDTPTGPRGEYKYSVELTRGGRPIVLDPQIEIMD